MKNRILKNILFTLVSLSINAQTPMNRKALDSQFDATKGFFRTSQFRVATGLSFDLSIGSDKGKALYINSSGNIDKDNISYASSPNMSYGLGLDFYSPFSTLGFYIEPSLNIQKYAISNNVNSLRDSINIKNIEVPIYAKLRFGNPKSSGHMWLALGGGYSFVSKATTTVLNNNIQLGSIDTKKQFQSIPYLSAMLGYEWLVGFSKKEDEEIYDRDDLKLVFFVKGNYDLANRIDNTGVYTNTSLQAYTKPELQFLRVSVGIKVLLRFSKLGQVVTEAAKQSLNK